MGDDAISGDGGNDLIMSGNGGDTISGGDGDDVARSGIRRDFIVGDDGNDDLRGGGDDDKLFGRLGDDRLFGGPGKNELSGEAGADFFVFKSRGAIDKVIDFNPAEDGFLFSRSTYSGIGPKGELKAKYFHNGDAETPRHKILYHAAGFSTPSTAPTRRIRSSSPRSVLASTSMPAISP